MTRNARPPNVLMVFPRFNPNSFWSLAPVCEIWGARAPAPPLGMITLAAMLPKDWNVRLLNRNSEDVAAADFEWADMVMTGGMLPQQDDALALIDLAQSFGKPVVVGGPAATSSPGDYRSADFLVLGEAEGVIEDFVNAW
ncbi:MAG TPA: cobalamin B12-binding domain-containing protein, partial [Xanthobacteraceae bacterium]|nr:cobalamin B12-binding domain-containing protein [Xanthobacteraceae bacterium]